MLGEERRKHIRIFLPEGQVRVSSGPVLALVGKVMDLSLGGIGFSGSSGFDKGDDVEMELTLPEGMKLRCVAKIVNAHPVPRTKDQVVYSAQFVDMATRDQISLGEFILKMRARQDSLLRDKLG